MIPKILQTALISSALVLTAGLARAAAPETLVEAATPERVWVVTYTSKSAVLTRGKRKIVLQENCVAVSKQYGRGVWGQANGGMLIKFGQRRLGFPRQEVRLDRASCDVPD